VGILLAVCFDNAQNLCVNGFLLSLSFSQKMATAFSGISNFIYSARNFLISRGLLFSQVTRFGLMSIIPIFLFGMVLGKILLSATLGIRLCIIFS